MTRRTASRQAKGPLYEWGDDAPSRVLTAPDAEDDFPCRGPSETHDCSEEDPFGANNPSARLAKWLTIRTIVYRDPVAGRLGGAGGDPELADPDDAEIISTTARTR